MGSSGNPLTMPHSVHEYLALMNTALSTWQDYFVPFMTIGYVCPLSQVLKSGCCQVGANSGHIRFECRSCKGTGCCEVYEHCVSCCMHPNKVSGYYGCGAILATVICSIISCHCCTEYCPRTLNPSIHYTPLSKTSLSCVCRNVEHHHR